MKAVRVSVSNDTEYHASSFSLPAVYRSGSPQSVSCSQEVDGQTVRTRYGLTKAGCLRTITLSGGRFTGLASQPGALLTFVISGKLTIDPEPADPFTLEAGDILFTEGSSATGLPASASRSCHLIQIGVPAGWPGEAPALDIPGTIIPRNGEAPNVKRLYTGRDGRSHFARFPELFSAPPDRWTTPVPVKGFRILCWEDGELDWHAGVVSQLAIFLSGETLVEVGGAGGAIEIFRAGDVCLGADCSGQGHADRTLGAAYSVLLAVESDHPWQ
jgi:hypothetical protein